jgi:hypothetical protein
MALARDALHQRRSLQRRAILTLSPITSVDYQTAAPTTRDGSPLFVPTATDVRTTRLTLPTSMLTWRGVVNTKEHHAAPQHG